MDKKIKLKILSIFGKIKLQEAKLCKDRDNLRELKEKIEDIIDPISDGCDELKKAIEDFERAIDTISQVV